MLTRFNQALTETKTSIGCLIMELIYMLICFNQALTETKKNIGCLIME